MHPEKAFPSIPVNSAELYPRCMDCDGEFLKGASFLFD